MNNFLLNSEGQFHLKWNTTRAITSCMLSMVASFNVNAKDSWVLQGQIYFSMQKLFVNTLSLFVTLLKSDIVSIHAVYHYYIDNIPLLVKFGKMKRYR